MKNILFLLILLFLTACSKVSDEILMAAHKAYEEGAIIVDVRTPQEYKLKHIQGAINYPVQELHNLYVRLPKDKEIIVYCRSGSRSADAARFLKQQGFTVYDVATQSDWEREIAQLK